MVKEHKNVKSRGFIYVINNWTDDDVAFAMSLYEDDINCTYNVIAYEVGRGGTPHLQCYIHYRNRRWLDSMKGLSKRWHVDPQGAKFNVSSYVYCFKTMDYYEMGERPRQGHRTDLEVIKYDLLKGRPMTEISKEYFSQWVQYRRSFDEFNRIHRKYVTKLYMFDTEKPNISIPKMYKHFDFAHDLLVESKFVMQEDELLLKFHSNKYRRIFIPSGHFPWPENILTNISNDAIQQELYPGFESEKEERIGLSETE